MFCPSTKTLENIQICSIYKGGRRVPNVSLKIWIHSKKWTVIFFELSLLVLRRWQKLENRCNLNYISKIPNDTNVVEKIQGGVETSDFEK